MIDERKLTPAPWTARESRTQSGASRSVCVAPPGTYGEQSRVVMQSMASDAQSLIDLEFAAIARNAFAIMNGRQWGVVHFPSGWCIAFKSMDVSERVRGMRWADPFTAAVEADAFLRLQEAET